MVAIGSPSGLHGEHGIAAARHGLHVLVEKPLEITAARSDALIAEAARAAVTLGVIFQDRLKPDVVRLKALIDAGDLGAPILGTARVKWHRADAYYRGSRWRGTKALDGGGALINQAIHTVDLLLWCFGPVRRVFGRTATSLHAIEAEDTAVAVLEFTNGALATVEATTAAFPGYARRLELTGSEGTVILDGDRLVRVDLRGRELEPCADEAPAATVAAASPVVADASAHQRVFEDFIRALSNGTSPACDGVGGRVSVAVIEAIYQSAASGVPVEMSRI
jgi:UDP-N-acetyl-2-amino-2-deoxyglucuronate dehydrogenase